MTTTSRDELPRLGRYQVLCKLAQGGMAEIFLAKALGVMGFERVVAVKLIHSSLTKDPEFVKMFIDEARIAMHLHHRNIVQVFDLDKLEDTYFIAMEYVHGVNVYDLYEAIAGKGRWVDTPLALYIVSEVCKGLHFAHARKGPDGRALGIVHRDISPQNVLLSFEGEVKITDFGIAKAQDRLHVTTPGIVKGKYAYMAPEVLSDHPATAQVDVFAAGVLLYELLVGENPFAGTTAVETIENVLNKNVEPPSARGAFVQAELDEITLRALAKDPKERYQTAQELSEALTEHGLNLTQARKDMASGDSTISALLTELFPDKAKSIPTATDLGSIDIPVLQKKSSQEQEPRQSYAPEPKVQEVPTAEVVATDPSTQPVREKVGGVDTGDLERTNPRPAIDPSYRAAMSVDERPTDRGLPVQKNRPVASDEDATLLNAGNVRDYLRDNSESDTEIPRDDGGPRVPEPQILPSPRPSAPPVSISSPPVSISAPPVSTSSPPVSISSPGPSAHPSMSQDFAAMSRPSDNRAKVFGLVALGFAVLVVLFAVGMSELKRPAKVVIPIRTTPAGAWVTIDGQRQPSPTPIEVTLPEGSHEIIIEKEGFQAERVGFLALPGVEGAEIGVELKQMTGTLTIVAEPADAKVSLNGAPQPGQGRFELSDLDLEKELVIRVEKSGYRSYETAIQLTPSQPERTVNVSLVRTR